jgi:hypothetical protein
MVCTGAESLCVESGLEAIVRKVGGLSTLRAGGWMKALLF